MLTPRGPHGNNPFVDKVKVQDFLLGEGEPLAIITGPCVIEDREHALRHAERLRQLRDRLGVPLIYKSSFDKANRSSPDSARGPGLDAGLEILAAVRDATGLPLLTDIHEAAQARPAAEVADVLQIPAFLCRQTSLIAAAAGTGKPVNVKKGQFLSPWDAANIAAKVRETAGPGRCLLTERGTSFGYNNLVVDFRALPVMRGHGVPVIFDATHSVQLPGSAAGGTATGGQREFVAVLARAAVAAGIDALFLEVHEDPDRAPCDGANMLPLDALEPLLEMVLRLREAASAPA